MTAEQYIQDGTLELYALGLLSPTEAAEVSAVLADSEAMQAELLEIEATLEQVDFATAVATPRAAVKQSVMAIINDEAPIKSPLVGGAHIEYEPPRSFYLAIAATIALLLGFGIFIWQDRKSDKEQIASLQKQLTEQQVVANIMANPYIQKVVLKGTPTNPDLMGTVFWDTQLGKLYFTPNNLKSVSKEVQYQLWAMVDGKPVNAGVFDVHNPGEMENIANLIKRPEAFAVTIEPHGGKSKPDMDKMVLFAQL